MNPRIFGAFLVGAGLIAFGYFMAPVKTSNTMPDPSVEAVVGTAPAREYIPVGDEDNDGIPDWSESFRQAKPVRVSNSDAPEETYMPPDTLTGQLAIELLEKTVRAKVTGPLGPSQEEILQSTVSNIEGAAIDALYSEKEITISADNSPETLRAYGNRVAQIALSVDLPEGTRPGIDILQHAVYTNNAEILNELDPIYEAYVDLRNGMLITEVPEAVAREHLNLLNTYNALAIDTEGMQAAFSDPMYTMVRMQRFYDDAIGLENALFELYTKLILLGATWSEGEPVTNFLNIE